MKSLREVLAEPYLPCVPPRRDNWPLMLDAWVQRAFTTPFSWGYWDCGLAAGTAIRMMTGFDPTRELRGRYKTEKQYHRFMYLLTYSHDVEQHVHWVMQRFKYPETYSPSLGDVCVVELGGRTAAGIYTRHGTIVVGKDSAIVLNGKPLRSWQV